MKEYKLDQTELAFSQLGYGCMNIGGGWKKEPATKEDVDNIEPVIMKAVDGGINLFDHADIYMMGRSEEVFGGVLDRHPGLREKILIQSKCGIRFNDSDPGFPKQYDMSYDHVVGSVESSLKRMGIEQMDLLLLHRPDPLMEPDEVARAFSDLQKSGKVRYFGVSNFNAAQMILLQESLDQKLVVNQMQLSLLHHHMINEGVMVNTTSGQYSGLAGTLDYCRKHQVLIQAWSPVAGGRIINPKGDTNSPTNKVAQEVRNIARRKQTSPEAIALAWLLRHPAQIQPIVGTTRLGRLEASMPAPKIELTRSEWYHLFEKARGTVIP